MSSLLGSQLAGLDQVGQQRCQGIAAEAVGDPTQFPANQVLASNGSLEDPVRLLFPAVNQIFVRESSEEFLDGRELGVAALGIQSVPQIANRRLSPLPKLLHDSEFGVGNLRQGIFLHEALPQFCSKGSVYKTHCLVRMIDK